MLCLAQYMRVDERRGGRSKHQEPQQRQAIRRPGEQPEDQGATPLQYRAALTEYLYH